MKKIFLYIVIGLILLAIPATVFLVGQQQEVRKRAAPATTLSFVPTNATVKVGETTKLNIDVDPGANQITSIKIALTFDPTKVSITSLTRGSSAPRTLTDQVIESGTASITVGAASNAQPISAKGTVAILEITGVSATDTVPSVIQFASSTFAAGLNEPTANVLIGTVEAKVTVTGSSVTVTPTLTPTQTLTPTLTPTPTGTGSAQATSSAVLILSPVSGGVTSPQPTFSGKAPPGSTVTIVVYSAPQTFTVIADTAGTWTFTPVTDLATGPHSIVASVLTGGVTQTTTSAFVVGGQGGGDATDAALPISGSVEMTITLIVLGLLCIASGILIPVLIP